MSPSPSVSARASISLVRCEARFGSSLVRDPSAPSVHISCSRPINPLRACMLNAASVASLGVAAVEAWAASGAGGRGGLAPPLGTLVIPACACAAAMPCRERTEERPVGEVAFGAGVTPATWKVPKMVSTSCPPPSSASAYRKLLKLMVVSKRGRDLAKATRAASLGTLARRGTAAAARWKVARSMRLPSPHAARNAASSGSLPTCFVGTFTGPAAAPPVCLSCTRDCANSDMSSTVGALLRMSSCMMILFPTCSHCIPSRNPRSASVYTSSSLARVGCSCRLEGRRSRVTREKVSGVAEAKEGAARICSASACGGTPFSTATHASARRKLSYVTRRSPFALARAKHSSAACAVKAASTSLACTIILVNCVRSMDGAAPIPPKLHASSNLATSGALASSSGGTGAGAGAGAAWFWRRCSIL
mmetsp:Transcript_13531/g.28815  ORF Transcript_13531/g.28815 Transcript_13531/m.28815 type:complete len:421 (-) Transcript_13531:2031-3293(-)